MKLQIYLALAAIWVSFTTAVQAQSITAADDGTGTVIEINNINGNQYDIGGGTQVDANLFHSFERFGLNQNQIANFLSDSSIRNILGRVTGGDASVINGMIRMSGGSSNLYLVNPAGIVFGAESQVNVPGSFTATTANGIQIGEFWFDALGDNNYANLVGEPGGFAFTTDNPGAVINAGDIIAGEKITLLGGTVINTGTLETPGGKITIAAVPGKQLVNISQEGSLVSLNLPTTAENNIAPTDLTPATLPQLLTGGDVDLATGVEVVDGKIRLTGSEVEIPNQSGTVVASGNLDVSSTQGGTATVLGNRVALVDAEINASGINGGGTVLIGGDYKGEGTIPNASQTIVSSDSTINASAIANGNGGKVIVWADGVTGFEGTIEARGGENSGDGGFVEVSGKQKLIYQGSVDTSAANGDWGTLLLDPTNIEVVAAQDQETNDLSFVDDETDANIGDDNITRLDVNAINNATSDIVLEATNDITFKTDIAIENIDIDLIAKAGGNITVGNIFNPRIIVNPKDGSLIPRSSNEDRGDGSVRLQAEGDITVQTIDAVGHVELISRNGNITAGSENSPVNLNSAVIPGFTEEKPFRSTPNDSPGRVYLEATKGTVQVFGIICSGWSGKTGDSTITVNSTTFRAQSPQLMPELVAGGDNFGKQPKLTNILPFPANAPAEANLSNLVFGKAILQVVTGENQVESFTIAEFNPLIDLNNKPEPPELVTITIRPEGVSPPINLNDVFPINVGNEEMKKRPANKSGMAGTIVIGQDQSPAVISAVDNDLFSEDLGDDSSDQILAEDEVLSQDSQVAVYCGTGEFSYAPMADADFIQGSCPGQILTYVFPTPRDEQGEPLQISPEMLPELLTPVNLDATGWKFDPSDPSVTLQLSSFRLR